MRIRRHDSNVYQSRNFNMSLRNSDALPPLNQETGTLDYSKIKVGVKQLEDAIIDFPSPPPAFIQTT